MVSKNNLQLLERKQQSRKQRFGLRKMSIGLVSVLLGLLFITNGNSASADEVATSEPATTAQASPDTATLSSATVAETSSAASSTAVSSSPVSSVPAESVNTTSSTANAPESALLAPALTASSSSVISEENASSANTNSIAAATSGTVQPVSSAIDNTVNDSEQPASEGARQDTTVGTVDTIHTDQILKDKYGIDVNHLDAKSVLLLASLFHIFANEANLGADVNGNIAVGNLNSNVDFGTRGESIHLTNGDIYYIQNLNAALQNGSFRNQEFNHVIFGEDVNVGIRDGQVYVNGEHMPNLKPEEVFKDGAGTSYIDFPAVFQRLIAASNFYAEQAESAGVIKDFNDMNNRYVDVSNAVAKDNVIYVNIPYEYLNGPQPIKIYGLSSRVNGPTVVINVIGMPADGQLDINTQIKLYYDDDRDNHVSPGESHAHPNHVLWNFGTAAADITIGSGHFMGSILAPNATVTANVNVDGNIVANVVNIKGGESHKWDIHPVQPTDPQPTDPQPTDPQPTDPQPTDPILPPTGEMEDAGAEPTGSQENATEQPTHSNTMNLGTTTVSYTSNQLTASPAHTAEQTATPTNASKNQTLPQTGASHEQAVLAGIILAITAQLLALGALSWKKYNEE